MIRDNLRVATPPTRDSCPDPSLLYATRVPPPAFYATRVPVSSALTSPPPSRVCATRIPLTDSRPFKPNPLARRHAGVLVRVKLLTIPAFYATRVPVGAILPPCVHLRPLYPLADTLGFSYVKMLTGGSSCIGLLRDSCPNSSPLCDARPSNGAALFRRHAGVLVREDADGRIEQHPGRDPRGRAQHLHCPRLRPGPFPSRESSSLTTYWSESTISSRSFQ